MKTLKLIWLQWLQQKLSVEMMKFFMVDTWILNWQYETKYESMIKERETKLA